MTEPQEVLAALDRLNGHARAWGCGKSAIYTYKKLVALRMALAGEVVARPIAITVDCNRCGGTGLYWEQDPNWKTPCRSCGRRGKVRLEFVETTLAGYVWHHPYADAGIDILRAAWGIASFDYEGDAAVAVLVDGQRRPIVYEAAGDWTPNRRGERLAADDAAHLLNTVEAWVAALPPIARGEPWWWLPEGAMRAVRSYQLDLGRIEGPCYRCGRSDDLVDHGIGHVGRLLHFSLRICAACDKEQPRRWPGDGDVPAHALTPAIRAWLDNPARAGKAAA